MCIRDRAAACSCPKSLSGGSGSTSQPAAAVAARLAALGPLPLLASPLLRTRQTATPLAQEWGLAPEIEPRVREIPSPPEVPEGERGPWLRRILFGTWAEADPFLEPWREGVLKSLIAMPQDVVVMTHFVVINTAVGAALGEERVMSFRPDNCSVTVLETDGERLSLIERGHEAQTVVR